MPFNLQDYEPVEERLARFWLDHPNGRILTAIIPQHDVGVVMLAQVWKDKTEHGNADATGHAQETPGSSNVNKTSWIENCETSAIGRALANLGYAPKGSRPSREEMQKASRPAPAAKPKPEPKATKSQQQRIAITAGDHGIDDELRYRITRMLFGVTSSKDVPRGSVNRLLDALKGFAEKRDANLKYLEGWEAEHPPAAQVVVVDAKDLPNTAGQAVREGPAPHAPATSPSASTPPEAGGEHILTREELEAAGQIPMGDKIPD